MEAKIGERLSWLQQQYHCHPDPLYIDGYIRGRSANRRPIVVDTLTEDELTTYLIGVFDGRDDARSVVHDVGIAD